MLNSTNKSKNSWRQVAEYHRINGYLLRERRSIVFAVPDRTAHSSSTMPLSRHPVRRCSIYIQLHQGRLAGRYHGRLTGWGGTRTPPHQEVSDSEFQGFHRSGASMRIVVLLSLLLEVWRSRSGFKQGV